jgi:hypothetical protein
MKRIRERLARFPLPEGFSYEDTAGASFESGMKELGHRDAARVGLRVPHHGHHVRVVHSALRHHPLRALLHGAGRFGLWPYTKTPLDLVGSIAAILLVGIVVKNGIVLIDCARRLIDEGRSREDALREAGRVRLRPILMTAATTILGLVPHGDRRRNGFHDFLQGVGGRHDRRHDRRHAAAALRRSGDLRGRGRRPHLARASSDSVLPGRFRTQRATKPARTS